MNENTQIVWNKKLAEFDVAFEEAVRMFSVFSLLAAGVSVFDEEVDVLNAQIIE